jgi:hypothetical protein
MPAAFIKPPKVRLQRRRASFMAVNRNGLVWKGKEYLASKNGKKKRNKEDQ